MTTAQVSIELIDALLSPTTNPNAESQYKSIAIPIRVQSLLSIIEQTLFQQKQQEQQQHNNATHIPRLMLSSVLLRREISSLGSYTLKNSVKLNSEWEIVRMLGESIKPLLAIFDTICINNHTFNDSSLNNVRRQIGFVIAQVCSTLSIMDDGISVDVMNAVLDKIAHGCSTVDKASLSLLSSLAQNSPLSLVKAKGDQLPSLLQAAIASLEQIIQKNTTTTTTTPIHQIDHQLQCIQTILDAINHISIASDMTYPQSLSNNPKERMVQMIQSMSVMQDLNPKKLTIDPHSKAAKIGKLCLPPLLSLMMTLLVNNTTSLDSIGDMIQMIMQTLSNCASTCPSLLVGGDDLDLLTIVFRTCIMVGEHNSLDPNVRLSALEALVTLLMVPEMKRLVLENAMLRNLCLVGESSGGKDGGIVGVCAELLVKGVDDDVDDWAVEEVASQDETQWENDDVANFAEMVLNTFLENGGGGSQSIPIVLGFVDVLLKSSEWQKLKAALTILEACLTTSPHAFSVHVPVAIEAALNFCSHPCVRVQHQAIQLIGSLCEFDGVAKGGVELRKDYGQRILQSLAQLLTSKCSKVICHACLSIVSFCRGGKSEEKDGSSIKKSYIVPYLGDVLQAIASGPLSLDVMSNIVVYIRAFASIACLADVAGSDFASFYENVIPGLMQCVSFGLQYDQNGTVLNSSATTHEVVSLRGAAIEAVTIVGQAIGSDDDRFKPEAQKIMNIVAAAIQYRSANNNTQNLIPQDQLLAAAARIASILEDAYTPFVPIILPSLLEVAKEEASVSITDGDPDSASEGTDIDEDNGTESITMNLPGMGVKKLVLNTSQIQEKALVARVVYEHANSMGVAFGPYVPDCFQAFIPLLQFKYSADVRATAAQAIGAIFASACEFAMSQGSQQHYTLVMDMYPKLLLTMSAQLQTEESDDFEILLAVSEALSNICYAVFSHRSEHGSHIASLSVNDADKFTSELLKVIRDCLARRFDMFALLEKSFDEDQRSEVEERLIVDSELLTNLVDSIGYNLKCLKEKFVPIFERHIAPAFSSILTSSAYTDPRSRFCALCLFCDCVEHCGKDAAARYGTVLSQGVCHGLNDSVTGGDVELKEVSVYSIAQIARHSRPETLNSFVGVIVPQLMSIAKEGEIKSKDEIDELRLVENSASALATLSLFSKSPYKQFDGQQKSEILRIFLSNLPLEEDEDEAKGLCELVEKGDIDISQNAELLVKIIGGIAAALADEAEVASEETCSRLVSILNQLQQTCNQNVVQHAFSQLTEEAQNGINMLLCQG